MNVRTWVARASKLRTILGHQPYRRALRFGVAASTEHMRTPLPLDYRTVLDVGANRGQFALIAAERFPRAEIVCFEPLAGPRAVLERVFQDGATVRVVGTAVAASAKASEMFVSRANDSSSLLRPSDLQLATFPGTDVVETVTFMTERLDVLLNGDELARPILLKIDVQGTELEVLRSAGRLLDEVDTVLVECSFVELYHGQSLADEIIRFLHDRSFRLAGIVNPYIDALGVVAQVDLVFARRTEWRS